MFFVRNGNKTDPLSPAEAAKYTVQHFNKTTQKGPESGWMRENDYYLRDER